MDKLPQVKGETVNNCDDSHSPLGQESVRISQILLTPGG